MPNAESFWIEGRDHMLAVGDKDVQAERAGVPEKALALNMLMFRRCWPANGGVIAENNRPNHPAGVLPKPANC